MQPLRIYPSKGKLLLFLVAGLALGAVSVVLIPDADGGEKALLIAAIAFGVMLLVFTAVKLIGNKPTLEIDGRGMTDRSSMMPAGRLRWDQVRAVHIHVLNGRRFLGVEPVDRAGYLASEGIVRKAVRSLSRGKLKDFPIIAIPAVTVSMPLETLLGEMRRFYPYLVILPEQTTTSS